MKNDQFYAKLDLHYNGTALNPKNAPSVTTATNIIPYEPNDGQQYSLPKLLGNCQALAYTADPVNQQQGRNAVPEPAWLALAQTVRLVIKGREAVHLVSKDDPRYSQPDVDLRLDAWEQKGFKGPATCEQIQKAYAQINPTICDGCPSRAKVKTPLVLAKYVALALVPPPDAPEEIPELPKPFVRTLDGGIAIQQANPKTQANETYVFCTYDMYPIKLHADEDTGATTEVRWRIKYPHSGWQNRRIKIVGRQHLSVTLRQFHIYVNEPDIPLMDAFMNAYVKKLQNDLPSEITFNKQGWRPDDSFVLGKTLYKKDGTVEEHAMSPALLNATHQGMQCSGSYEQWQQDVGVYQHGGLEPWRVFLISSFASALYKFTGLVATAINASGNTGVGKSTVMEVAASIWGEPDALKIHGDATASTQAGAEGLASAMNSLPVFMDEITMRDPKQVAQLIFSYSGGKGKLRGTITGGVAANTATWSNFLMLNANHDEYERIAMQFRESAQHIVRLIQIPFPTSTISKEAGDRVRRSVHENYGWAGRIFIEWVVRNQDAVRKRIEKTIKEIDRAVRATPEERFWTGWVACLKVSYEICLALNILPWLSWTKDEPWLYQQIGLMRQIVLQHEPVAGETISEFLDSVSKTGTLTISAKSAANIDNISGDYTRELVVRREPDIHRIYISRNAFRQYCIEHSVNFNKTSQQMQTKRILLRDNLRKVLGAGTKFESGSVRCMELDSKALANFGSGVP